MDSDDEGFGSEDEYSMEDISDEDMSDEGDYFDPASQVDVSKKAAYEVLTEAKLRERQQETMQEVTSVTGLLSQEAGRVLRHFKWDPNRVNEEYFSDIHAVRERVGIVDDDDDIGLSAAATAAAAAASPAAPARKGRGRQKEKKVLCSVCYDEYAPSDVLTAACRHPFCKDCWHGYVSNAVSSGPSCLDLRCPQPDCKAAVPGEIIDEVLNNEEAARVDQFALRSYVEDNSRVSWCPAAGCAFAVEYRGEVGNEPLDITCKCGSTFCFTCKEEAHRPVDCATVAKWLLKNSAESENLNWILANTKPCPKCKRPIEKNHGCMHMNCSQCRHEFCWLCLDDWKTHGEGSGGFYQCNRYETGKKQGKYTEEDARREHAKQSLERYMHYFQRFAENDKGRKLAIKQSAEFLASNIETLSELTATPTSQLKLVADAWAQVVDCRRILKWTYAYGYYTFHRDEPVAVPAVPLISKERQDFFEFSQGQAESFLEKLHKMVESDLGDFVEHTKPPEDWPRAIPNLCYPLMFRENLIGLTDVTHSHFAKLVTELEKGMDSLDSMYSLKDEDMDSQAAEEAASAAARAKGSKRGRGQRNREPAAVTTALGAGSANDPFEIEDTQDGQLLETGYWACRACTFANADLDARTCEMCDSARPE